MGLAVAEEKMTEARSTPVYASTGSVRSPHASRTTVYVEGHGCSASFADTEIISGLISNGGYELVDEETDADLSVLVTCSVKTVTEQRMLHRIRELNSSGRKIVVAGCLAKSEPKSILSIDGSLSLVSPGNLDDILPAIDATLGDRQLISINDQKKLVKLGLPRTRRNRCVGIVEIGSGCLSSCTFCQVKLVKGNIFSYPEEQIVDEARRLLADGASEIWLTSTDNSAYGKDSRTTLSTLVNKVSLLPGEFRIRIGMMNPLLTKGDRVIEDLLEAFEHEKVFKFLHLPVQSGSERILRLMRRGYTVSDYLSIVESFRSRIPNLTLSTDVIVGFPTETDNDFDASMDLVRESKPDVLNLSRFGAREGTVAAEMEGRVPEAISKGRSARMSKEWKSIALSKNLSWVGSECRALVDERVRDGAVVARNDSYKPIVLRGDESMLGKFATLRVTSATSFTLNGKVVN